MRTLKPIFLLGYRSSRSKTPTRDLYESQEESSQSPARDLSYTPRGSPLAHLDENQVIDSPIDTENNSFPKTVEVNPQIPTASDQERSTQVENQVQPELSTNETQGLNKEKREEADPEVEILIVEDLDADILEVIGDRVDEERILAPPIPNSIAIRLKDISKQGLPKEERTKLLKDNTPPKNCVTIDPPKMNEEIKGSLVESSIKRDERIVEKQKKITASLALLGSAITEVINDSKCAPAKIALIKKLSEAARLMADVQRDESLTRRSLIIANINKT